MQTAMASRLAQLLGDETLEATARRLADHGCVVSPQAIHKWRRGGAIGEDNLMCICRAYNVEPAWLRYGVGNRSAPSPVKDAGGELIESLPDKTKQAALDFIEWNIQRDALVDRESFGRYLRMIDKIRHSMDGLRDEDSKLPPQR